LIIAMRLQTFLIIAVLAMGQSSLGQAKPSWSLTAIPEVSVPTTEDSWVRSPVDAFILRRLQVAGLKPSKTADRRTLIRRLTFDLHGLPPSPEEVRVFLADPRKDAYQRLVDRLLASPRYGERWGRHWLDVVHYGETHGYDKDKLRKHAWPYRDWVIRSLNDDKPYGRFVEEQLAGDALQPVTPDGIIGLGFIASGPWDFVGHVELREGTIDKQKIRSLDRDDMLANAMSTFVSTTAHCARCHDHKFDPIPQRDYYRLQAVFAGVERGDRPYQGPASEQYLTSHAKSRGYHSLIEKSQETSKWVQVDLGAVHPIDTVLLFPSHEKYGGHPGPGFGFPARFRVEISSEASFANATLILDHSKQDFPHPGDATQSIAVDGKQGRYVRVTATRLWKRTEDWIFALGELVVLSAGKNLAARAAVTALDSIEAGGSWGKKYLTDGAAMRTGKLVYAANPAPKVRPIHLLKRGNVTHKGPLIQAGALSCLPDLERHFVGIEHSDEMQRRVALARWIIDPANPLTWRSIVNRVWQYHFGRGLVGTPNDFGLMGEKPTHPQLLDWMARWFRDGGGSLKRLHRLLVCSAVYQQSSSDAGQLASKRDAENRLLWRMPRKRLEAEAVRDSVLSVSGRIDLKMGGSSARWFGFEDDHSPRYDYRAFDPDAAAANRRSVYRHIVRSVPDPFMECLDCADASVSTPKRFSTLTALQALTMLNNPFVLRQAEHFATRLRKASSEPKAQINEAFRLAFSRQASGQEIEHLLLYRQQHGLANMCRLIFNLNEFLFVD
jgi:hypothetical protein